MGLYVWAHYLLPMLHTKSGSNPQCRDLVLQLMERWWLDNMSDFSLLL